MPTGFEDYFVTDPKYAALPGPSGIPLGMDPGGGFLLDLLGLGGDKKKDSWVERDGYMVHTSGNYAPIPISDVPGTGKVPTKAYRQTAENIRMLEDFLPLYAKAIAGQIIPQEQAKLEAALRTSPQMAELMKNLYQKYGPELADIGNDIARKDAFASAERDRDVLKGPGKEVIEEALAAMETADPEFFSTRKLTSERLADLLGSPDLSGKLSEVEKRELEQQQAAEGVRRGTINAPSNTATLENLFQYGEAGQKKKTQERDALTKAITASSIFLPNSRTGFDPFQVATGKPSGVNPGANKFTGITSPNDDAFKLAGGLFGNIGANSSQQADINATAKLNEKDWLDQFQQFTSGLGNLGSFAGAAMCWVARSIYGSENSKWIQFRNWMIFNAPLWLFNLYLKRGERFAEWVHNKPRIKRVIKYFMDKAISKEKN